MKSIRSLYAAGLIIGACMLAAPSLSAAQGNSHKDQKVERKIDQKVDRQIEKNDTRADKHATRRVITTRHRNRVITRTTRARVLCEDGSWSYANCADHGGLASRQYTPIPRASQQAILHANAHSAVARGYASRLRARAIARCNDGTWWHATTRDNACYNHRGVASWL